MRCRIVPTLLCSAHAAYSGARIHASCLSSHHNTKDNALCWAVMLTLAAIEDVQAECMADDITIDYERMRHWSQDDCRSFFESGGTLAPTASADATASTNWLSQLAIPATTPAGDGQGAGYERVFAMSDIHIDKPENREWLLSICDGTSFARDVLILAGDVTDDPDALKDCLRRLAATFAKVFYTVGNHDLWLSQRSTVATSNERLHEIHALCEQLGIATRPGFAAGAIVVPILSWHHQSWDTEPDLRGWSGFALPEHCIMDYYRCK